MDLRAITMRLTQDTPSPYLDSPQQIGWNTTISAPSMHAETFKYLYEHMKRASNLLDIGTGSGFVTAVMGHVSPGSSKVYAVDHIADINKFAKGNISRVCPHLLRRDKIQFVT
mmetsp:Transcript_24801/g.38598  ORF Transcript_24801/g.38598 Transcript_24801/m.38598 type:complete len:113 (+) Transcript_24801:1417-1755(+)